MSRVFDNSQTGAAETYILAPANAVYNSLPAATVAAWVYLTSYPASSVIVVKDPLHTYSIALYINNSPYPTGALSADIESSGGGGISVSNEVVPLNTWTHVLMAFDLNGDSKAHLFINGVECTYFGQSAAGSSTPNDDSGGGWYIGNDTFDDGLSGSIAEVAIWDIALSGAQILAISSSPAGAGGIAAANLAGYWHLCGRLSPEPDTAGGNSGVLHGTPPPTTGAVSPGFNCSTTRSYAFLID